MGDPVVRPPRSVAPLYAFLGVALLVGLVAALLAGAAPTAPTAQAGELVVNLPAFAWVIVCLGPLVGGFAVIIARRVVEGGVPMGRALVTGVVILVLLIGFVYLTGGHHPLSQGSVGLSSGGGGGNRTTPPVGNNSTHGANGTSVPPTYIWTIPPWLLLVVGVGLSACAAALALPGVLSRLVDRAPRRPALAAARLQVQSALAEAGAAIDRGADPREAVIQLYVRLLVEIAPRVGDVAPLTADEIRQVPLAALGVRAAASEALTRLFEEARYSTHPIGPVQAGRVREAIRQIEDDLRRGSAS